MPCARGGSSPRVRGTVRYSNLAEPYAGIIPACAGNRVSSLLRSFFFRDHPRVCGEQIRREKIDSLKKGSSPRVRGTVFPTLNFFKDEGIIPACAGNSLNHTLKHLSNGDHPRVCGEQFCLCCQFNYQWGSSPRVRGTGKQFQNQTKLIGIIPACAGNRPRYSSCGCHSGDHPRVCGEQKTLHLCNVLITGSSPRVRGTEYPTTGVGTVIGIIPACAGNSYRH